MFEVSRKPQSDQRFGGQDMRRDDIFCSLYGLWSRAKECCRYGKLGEVYDR